MSNSLATLKITVVLRRGEIIPRSSLESVVGEICKRRAVVFIDKPFRVLNSFKFSQNSESSLIIHLFKNTNMCDIPRL